MVKCHICILNLGCNHINQNNFVIKHLSLIKVRDHNIKILDNKIHKIKIFAHNNNVFSQISQITKDKINNK